MAGSCLNDGQGLARDDADHLAVARALGFEHHLAVAGREQRVVFADADVGAGMELGAALAYQNIAGQHRLAGEALDAQPLGVGIAAVARAAACFFMCHECFLV